MFRIFISNYKLRFLCPSLVSSSLATELHVLAGEQVIVVQLRVNVNLKAIIVEELICRRKVCRKAYYFLPFSFLAAFMQILHLSMLKNLRYLACKVDILGKLVLTKKKLLGTGRSLSMVRRRL
jgi:hypothetical protein